MAVNPADVERALMLAIGDADTPAETRAACNRFIEELKEGPGEVLLGVSLQLSNSQNPHVAHLALKLVQHAIKFKWNSLDVQTRIVLKEEVMRRMQIGPPPTPRIGDHSAPSLSSPSHWAEPLAVCVTLMAEHEWPQHWPDLSEKLHTMAVQAIAPATSIAVLCVIRRLLEDVIVFATVSNTKRRREMQQAIHDGMKSWLAMCIQLFADARMDDDESLLVVKHVIGLLSIMVESATTPEMEPLIDQMVNHLVRFLSTASHSIYEEAAMCLTGIASRKKSGTAEKVVVDTFFRDNVIKALLETASMASHVAQSSEEHYKYLKALCDTLTTVGKHLVSVWTITSERTCKTPPPPVNFGLYMSALSEFALHPALWLRSEATAVFIRFAACSHTRKWKELKSTLGNKILPRLVELIEKKGMPSSSKMAEACPSTHYARMDYDDDVAWAHDFTQYRTRIFNLVRETMDDSDHNTVLLTMVEQQVLQRVALDPNAIEKHEWDGLLKLCKTVLTLAFEKNLIEKKRETLMIHAFEMIIETIATKASFATANEALSVLSALYPIIDRQPQLLERLLDLLERLAAAAGPPAEQKELKRHLVSTIISIVSKHERVAKDYWQRIFEVINRIAQASTLMQHSQIANAIAALSNVVDNEDDKKRLLEIALGPQLEALQKMQSLFTSAYAFLDGTGFLVPPPTSQPEAEQHAGVRMRKQLRSTLCAIEGIIQKVEGDSPIGPILVPQCEAFARLVRILFELYDPETLTVVHAAYGGILQIPYGERQSIYCTVGENMDAVEFKREDARGSIALAIQFLSEINDTLQSILSICASKFAHIFYALPALPSILADCAANLERLPDFRVRYWLKKAWPTLVMCASPEQLPAVAPLLSTVVEHCQRRLEALWTQVSAVDYDSDETPEETLFLEHMTCVLSRELIGFLKTVFVHEEKHTTQNTTNTAAISFRLSSIGCAVYNMGGSLLSSFVTLTFSALAWRDTQSCVKAIPVAKAIVDKLAESFNEEAAVFALVNVLQSIRIHGSDEVAIGPLLNIIFHTYSSLRPHSVALRHVIEQLPDTPAATIDAFDKRAIAISRGLEEMPEKARKDMVRKLLRPIISVTLGELGRRPVELRPLPPIEKRAKPANEEEPDYGAVGDFFGH